MYSSYNAAGQPSNPTQAQSGDIFQWFQSVDQDRSGKITATELRQALINGNYTHFSLEACKTLISLFNVDQTQTIDFIEFQNLFVFVNQWKEAFERFDRDKSRAIDDKELEQALTQMGYRLSPQTVQAMIKKYESPSKKNQITFDNFIVACVQLQKLTSMTNYIT